MLCSTLLNLEKLFHTRREYITSNTQLFRLTQLSFTDLVQKAFVPPATGAIAHIVPITEL